MKLRSALRQHFQGRGAKMVPKVAFARKDDAVRHLHRHGLAERLVPYRCSVCGSWHVGRPRGS